MFAIHLWIGDLDNDTTFSVKILDRYIVVQTNTKKLYA